MKPREVARRIKRDNMKLSRYSRGFLLWLSQAVTLVVAAGLDAASEWTPRQWGIRLVIAGLAGVAGIITAGEKNPR